MKRSTNRILTTHIGSLPRPRALVDDYQALETGQPLDKAGHEARVKSEVARIVRRQVECGIDGVNDGEFGKSSFLTYVNTRLSGFEQSKEPLVPPWFKSKEGASFPAYVRHPALAYYLRQAESNRIRFSDRANYECLIADTHAGLFNCPSVDDRRRCDEAKHLAPRLARRAPRRRRDWLSGPLQYYALERRA